MNIVNEKIKNKIVSLVFVVAQQTKLDSLKGYILLVLMFWKPLHLPSKIDWVWVYLWSSLCFLYRLWRKIEWISHYFHPNIQDVV